MRATHQMLKFQWKIYNFRDTNEHGRSYVNAKELEEAVLERRSARIRIFVLIESTCNFIIVLVGMWNGARGRPLTPYLSR